MARIHNIHVTPFDYDQPLNRSYFAFNGLTNPGSAAWPANNQAIYLPLTLFSKCLVARFMCVTGNNTSTIDIGLFDANSGAKLTSTGATAKSTTVCQYIDTTDFFAAPGEYYIGGLIAATTGTLQRIQTTVLSELRAAGVLTEAVGGATLPATMSFTTGASALYVPLLGFTQSATL